MENKDTASDASLATIETQATTTDTAEIVLAPTDNTPVAQDNPPPSIEQLTLEVKFYLGQMQQNAIEVGKRLILAKSLLKHGEWGNWLKENFDLTDRSAQSFMKIANRFGDLSNSQNPKSISDLSPTQMITLLALPKDETENFIAEKAAEGTPVQDMTIRFLRDAIKQYMDAKIREQTAETAARIEKLETDYSALSDAHVSLKADNEALRNERDSWEAKSAVLEEMLQQPPTEIAAVPDDYEQTKQALDDANETIARLKADKNSVQQRLNETQEELDNQLSGVLERTVYVKYLRDLLAAAKKLNRVEHISNVINADMYETGNDDYAYHELFELVDKIKVNMPSIS